MDEKRCSGAIHAEGRHSSFFVVRCPLFSTPIIVWYVHSISTSIESLSRREQMDMRVPMQMERWDENWSQPSQNVSKSESRKASKPWHRTKRAYICYIGM
ncbi:hypothetical protein ACMFMG_010173 [Clarireedia jacksonii]